MLRVRAPACVAIKRPHTTERRSVFKFFGAPRALEAYISPNQRALIALSMSEQIHVHTSIHEASHTHSKPTPSPIFLLLLSTRMWLHIWDSLIHVYTHISGDINNFRSCRGAHTHNMHVKQTVTPSPLQSFFSQKGCHTHASTTEAQLVYLTVILFRWRGLSCPLAGKGLAFSRRHNKRISQGSAVCVSASSPRDLILIDGVFDKRHSLYCGKNMWISCHCSKQNTDALCLSLT